MRALNTLAQKITGAPENLRVPQREFLSDLSGKKVRATHWICDTLGNR